MDSSLDDDVYRALANTPRRYTVCTLLEWNRVSVDELADMLTGWIHANEYRMAMQSDREQLLMELQESHIDTLQDAGLVGYDPHADLLVLPDLPRPVTRLLRWAQANEYPS